MGTARKEKNELLLVVHRHILLNRCFGIEPTAVPEHYVSGRRRCSFSSDERCTFGFEESI